VSCTTFQTSKLYYDVYCVILQEIHGHFIFRLNIESYYGHQGQLPSIDLFLSESDSPQQRHLKKLFYRKAEKSLSKWKFFEELVKSLNSQVDILSRGCLTFLKLSFEFQVKIKTHIEQFDDCFIHPFGDKTMSISGYTFKLCKFFFLRNIPMRAVKFENTGGSGNVSKPEITFAAYKSFMEPSN